MSKKKGKAAPKKAPMKKAATRPASRPRATTAAVGTDSGGYTRQATIFIFRTGNGNRIRTSPQKIYANPGDRVEWSVVNLVDASDVPVTISWPDKSPFGERQFQFKSVNRQSLASGAQGTFKYVVSALDAVEDPELEIPDI